MQTLELLLTAKEAAVQAMNLRLKNDTQYIMPQM